MQDVADRYTRPAAPSLGDFGDVLGEREQANTSAGATGAATAAGAAVGPAGFVVKGGPWEQRAPDTASTQEFPTMPGGPRVVQQPAPTPTAAWGPRR